MNAAILDCPLATEAADPSGTAGAWTPVCAVDDIVPNTGVCALVAGRHVAVFRVGQDQFYAIDNIDPKTGASVLSRGLIGSLGGRIVVASPLYKQHIDLSSGECLEDPAYAVQAHRVSVHAGQVSVALA
jgi:nitrite reductase (NADH) small subunit